MATAGLQFVPSEVSVLARILYAGTMARWEQYEVWVLTKGKWEVVAHFSDMEVASAVFRNRTYRQKLVHAVYEDGNRVSEDVMAEVGRTREEP